MSNHPLFIGTRYRIISCTNPNRTLEIRWAGSQALYEDRVYGLEIDGVKGCWNVDFIPDTAYDAGSEEFGNLPLVSDTFKIDGYDDCEECLKVYYKFIDCETGELIPDPISSEPSDLRIDNEVFAEYVGKTAKITVNVDYEGDQYSLEYCATVTTELALGLRVLDSEILNAEPTACYRNCEECQAPETVIPEPEQEIKKPLYQPNYNIPGCSPDYYNKVNSEFSDIQYKDIVQKRYGLEICKDSDVLKYTIKKQLLDLEVSKNSSACDDDNGLFEPCVEGGGIGFMTINGDDCNPFTIYPAT